MIAFLDGFAHYGPGAQMIAQGGYMITEGARVVAGAGRFGDPAAVISVGADHSGLRLSLGGSHATVGFGYGIKLNQLPSLPSSTALFQASGTYAIPSREWQLVTITVLPTGALQVRPAQSEDVQGDRWAPVVETSAPVILAGVFHFVAGAFDFLSTGIVYRISVDGIVVLDGFAGYTEPNPPVSQPTIVMAAGCVGGPKTGGGEVTVSDLTITKGAAPGADPPDDVRIWTRFAAADGLDQDWEVVGAADAVSALGGVPPVDVSRYVFSPTVGDRVGVKTFAFPAELSEVSAVSPRSRLWATGAVDAAIQLESGGAETVFASHTIGTKPLWYGSVSELAPATGLAWTVSDINAAQIILEHIG